MTTTFTDVFDKLIEDRHVKLPIAGSSAEALRVSLVRRWGKYKKTYDDLGFLSDELRNLSVSMVVESDGTSYYLRFKANRISYTILPSAVDNISKGDNGK